MGKRTGMGTRTGKGKGTRTGTGKRTGMGTRTGTGTRTWDADEDGDKDVPTERPDQIKLISSAEGGDIDSFCVPAIKGQHMKAATGQSP